MFRELKQLTKAGAAKFSDGNFIDVLRTMQAHDDRLCPESHFWKFGRSNMVRNPDEVEHLFSSEFKLQLALEKDNLKVNSELDLR